MLGDTRQLSPLQRNLWWVVATRLLHREVADRPRSAHDPASEDHSAAVPLHIGNALFDYVNLCGRQAEQVVNMTVDRVIQR